LSAEQRVAIRAALEGRDSLVVIPDDALAMACYQLVAPLFAQPTVVLSPVLADLQTQSDALVAQRKPAVCIFPELSGPERSAALARVTRGGPLLVLLSPEALVSADVQKALAKSGIALFVVEEAHCASELSHEIRPSYAELGRTLQALGRPAVMALTRVANSAVLRDVSTRLSLTESELVQAPAVRRNLRIVTRLAQGDARQAALVRLIERLEPPGLVLCASPHDVDSVYSALRGSRIAAHRYHSGMTPGDRATELMNFTLPGERSVLVAVSAFAPGSGLPGLGEPASGAAAGFGRGAGKRDLRFVVHYQSPASIEQYLREIGRAGRDGLPATCVLFHESSHRSLHEVLFAQQRFRATHLAEIGRALEAPALEGRTVTLESLALGTGQSRRTTDRLTALLADAGVLSKTGGWVRVLTSASDLAEACRRLGAQLYALREQDTRRLAAVSTFAETTDCKLGYLSRYLGESTGAACGRCSACSSELIATESVPPQVAARRAVVQEFSVRPVVLESAPALGGANAALGGAGPLTATLADFGAAMPRAGR
jgi:ATP-dependent DNA helicase RecQ